MRDFTVEQLQAFLRENNVDFETKPAPEQLEAAGEEKEEEEEEEEGGDGEAKAGEGNGGCSCRVAVVALLKVTMLLCRKEGSFEVQCNAAGRDSG